MQNYNIGIVGLGLIGGSLGKALVSLDYNVFGYDVDAKTNQLAKADGIVIKNEFDSLIGSCDIVFIAVPGSQLEIVANSIVLSCRKKIIVSDVGSVKRPFQSLAQKYRDNKFIQWIGAHPLAGTEFNGYENSYSDLLSGAVWALALDPNATVFDAFYQISEIVSNLKGRILPLCPESHDYSVARISHFPYVISSLVGKIAGENKYSEIAINLAAGSFRDCTRVSGSDPSFSTDLILSNVDNLTNAIDDAINMLSKISLCIKNSDVGSIMKFFSDGQEIRRKTTLGEKIIENILLDLNDPKRIFEKLLQIGEDGKLIISMKKESNILIIETLEFRTN